jgi:hypothetical protein
MSGAERLGGQRGRTADLRMENAHNFDLHEATPDLLVQV